MLSGVRESVQGAERAGVKREGNFGKFILYPLSTWDTLSHGKLPARAPILQ